MSGRISALLLAGVLVLSALLFFNRAAEHGRRVNVNVDRTDQGAYIKQGIAMRDSDFSFVSARNRMPLYPGLLAMFLEKGAEKSAFFEKGKRINTVLSFLGLIFIGVIFLRRFPRHHALNILFLAAFTVFLFKAPYVQSEVLYYLLTFAVFLLGWRLFGRPAFWLAMLTGGLLGLAHLTKASVLPGLVVIVVFLPLDALWQRWRAGRSPLGKILAAAVVAAAFLATVYPYIANSKRIYGHYFYNVNSTFYIWCDSWKEATSRTRDAGDRRGWPDLPADQIPSFSNYVKTHTAGQIVWRIVHGISVVFNSMMKSYGYLGICVTYLAFAAFLVAWKWRLALRLFLRRPFPPLALLAYFGGYYLLVAWYSVIIDGNRFILGLFLPFLFTVSAVIFALAPRLRWTWGGREFNAFAVFNTLMSVWIAVEIAVICFWRVLADYGGS